MSNAAVNPPTNPGSTPAGWYPSPDGAPVLRWWDGRIWSTATSPLQPGQASGPPRKPLAGLGLAARVGIVVLSVVSLLGVAVEWYGIVAVTGYMDGSKPFESLTTYDNLTLMWGALYLVAALIAGILWMVWQYRAAVNAGSGVLRRTPAWHAWSWVIPVIAFWFPYQNISDLHRATGTNTPRRGVWWALWLASGLLVSISNQMLASESLEFESLPVAIALSLIGSLLVVAAAPFAWSVVKTLTPPLDAR